MNVIRPQLQTALIHGINHTVQHKRQLGAKAPDYLAQNIESGFKVLHQIGLGSELGQLEGPIRILATEQRLTQQGSAEDPDAYIQLHAHEVTTVLHALHRTLAYAESQQILGGLTLLDGDEKVYSLLHVKSDEPESKPNSGDIIVKDLELNVPLFFDRLEKQTLAWSELSDDLQSLDPKWTPERRAHEATLATLNLLRKIALNVRYINHHIDQLRQIAPQQLDEEKMEAYAESIDHVRRVVQNILKDFLNEPFSENFDAEDWQALWSFYWRQLHGATALTEPLDDDSLSGPPVLRMVGDTERERPADKEKQSDFELVDEILEAVRVIAIQRSGFLTRGNLWGLGWNPVRWNSRRAYFASEMQNKWSRIVETKNSTMETFSVLIEYIQEIRAERKALKKYEDKSKRD